MAAISMIDYDSRDEKSRPTGLKGSPNTLVNKILESPRLSGLRAPPTTPESGPSRDFYDIDAITDIIQHSVDDLLGKRPSPTSLSESIHAPRSAFSQEERFSSPLAHIEPPRFSTANRNLSPEAQRQQNASFHRVSFAVADSLHLVTATNSDLSVGRKKNNNRYAVLTDDSDDPSLANNVDQEASDAKYERPNISPEDTKARQRVPPHLRLSNLAKVARKDNYLYTDAKKPSFENEGAISYNETSRPPHLRLMTVMQEKKQVVVEETSELSPWTEISPVMLERSSSEETITPVRRSEKPLEIDESIDNAMRFISFTSTTKIPSLSHKEAMLSGNNGNLSHPQLEIDSTAPSNSTLLDLDDDIFWLPAHQQSPRFDLAPTTEKLVSSVVTNTSEVSFDTAIKVENHHAISLATSEYDLVRIEKDHRPPRSVVDETIAPSSMFSEAISSDNLRSTSNKTTANAVATAKEDPEDLIYFGASWPKPSERDQPKAKIRKVFMTNLPPYSTAAFVASLVYGGIVENISLSKSLAVVLFLHHEDCLKYSEASRNGIVYKTERTDQGEKEHFVLVKLATEVDIVGSNLKMMMGYHATRCIQVRGLVSKKEALERKEGLVKAAIGKRMRIEGESVEESVPTGRWTAILRLCNLEDAWRLRSALIRDENWESMNISHGIDPCAVATGVHF